ncbi:MAG: ACP S-malonyltransferase [Deltaproteobacteria bacterium]|nr:ACP S-malonyltransferase [Deltaproteobacteria bacterium]
MAKVAFIFPGQGAQAVGMGKAVFERFEEARAVFDAADKALQQPLSKLCFEGPEEELKLTANTQPALLATSIALLRALGESCDIAAGHSLGEYSAHVAAGTLAFEQAVQLVQKRGRFMQEAVPVGKGAMAAILGGHREAIERACEETEGVVQPVNYNCPGQIVIAGESDAVERAKARISALGTKIRSLQVSAPFHCELMKPAEDRLRPYLEKAFFSDPRIPVVVNTDAEPVHTKERARDALIRQVSSPVLWQQSVEKMLKEGVKLFVEIGPGGVLSGMIARIDKQVERVRVESPDDFGPAREAILRARSE